MCDFLSYIELNNEYLFLTDKEVFSSYGKKTLSFKDNDPLGHEAIRNYYNITGGVEHECRDFWKLENFPTTIQEVLKDFDKNFGKMFTFAFQNDDLIYIIEYGTEEYKIKAWEQLLKQKPNNNDLRYIIKYGTEEYKAKAELLLE